MIHFLDQTNNDLVMFRPIHINSSQLLCACQGSFNADAPNPFPYSVTQDTSSAHSVGKQGSELCGQLADPS